MQLSDPGGHRSRRDGLDGVGASLGHDADCTLGRIRPSHCAVPLGMKQPIRSERRGQDRKPEPDAEETRGQFRHTSPVMTRGR